MTREQDITLRKARDELTQLIENSEVVSDVEIFYTVKGTIRVLFNLLNLKEEVCRR